MAGFNSTMSKEVLLLGLLKKKPMYGYEIKQLVDEELVHVAPITSGSLYHNLKILEKRGLVTKSVLKDTAHPEKQIYHITDEGVRTFDSLLQENITNFERPHLALDISFYFLRESDAGQFLDQLRELRVRLKEYHTEAERFKDELASKGAPENMLFIPAHYLAHSEAEIKFLEGIIGRLEAGREGAA